MANGLEKFADDLKGKPPRTVSATKLDRNFARCIPSESGLLDSMGLKFSEDGSGWHLEFLPPINGTYVLGSVNGQVQWIATEDCGNGDD
jgi:hypothetical protein